MKDFIWQKNLFSLKIARLVGSIVKDLCHRILILQNFFGKRIISLEKCSAGWRHGSFVSNDFNFVGFYLAENNDFPFENCSAGWRWCKICDIFEIFVKSVCQLCVCQLAS